MSEKINAWQKFGLALIAVHLTFQIVFPLRHFAYPGYSSWTEEGHNFAWHMKLRGKSGTASFIIRDPSTQQSQKVDPRKYLTDRQARKMATRPDLLLQFAHYLRDLYTLKGEKPVEVYAETKIRVNGRKPQRLVDPQVNLAKIEPSIFHVPWVLPLRQPVWNAQNKRNRFGPAFKKDAIAIKAIHKFTPEHQILGER